MIKKGSKFRRLGDLVVLANMVHLLVFRTGNASLYFERKSIKSIIVRNIVHMSRFKPKAAG